MNNFIYLLAINSFRYIVDVFILNEESDINLVVHNADAMAIALDQFGTWDRHRDWNINSFGVEAVVGSQLHALMLSDVLVPAAAKRKRQNLIIRDLFQPHGTHS